MAESKEDGIGKEISAGLKTILERISDFFDIFDLSFLVSGITTMAALLFAAWRTGAAMPPLPAGWMMVLGLLIGCYVMGLVCFAVGRFVRTCWFPAKVDARFRARLDQALAGHGLASVPPIGEYLAQEDARTYWRLYVRLWAELRHSPSMAPHLSLLKRYWVMAATYDGVAVALLVWALVSCFCGFWPGVAIPVGGWLSGLVAFGLLLASLACGREAGRYLIYQVEEIVASLAVKRFADSMK